MKKLTIYIVVLFLSYSHGFAKTAIDDSGNTAEEQAEPQRVETKAVRGQTTEPVGEKEAQKYFKARGSGSESSSASSGEHYLLLHVGSFFTSDSYAWGGTAHVTNTGRLTAGLTYRLGNYGSFADSAIRVDVIGYDLPEGKPVQIAILPMIMFPEVSSKFPLYFGGGIGAGFFFNQITPESFLSFNYQLVAGARFFNVLENTGFFFEGGLKNNILILSDGQYIGYFVSVGAVFTF